MSELPTDSEGADTDAGLRRRGPMLASAGEKLARVIAALERTPSDVIILRMGYATIAVAIAFGAGYVARTAPEWFAGEAFATLLIGTLATGVAVGTIRSQAAITRDSDDAARNTSLLQLHVADVRRAAVDVAGAALDWTPAITHLFSLVSTASDVTREVDEPTRVAFLQQLGIESATVECQRVAHRYRRAVLMADYLGGGYPEFMRYLEVIDEASSLHRDTFLSAMKGESSLAAGDYETLLRDHLMRADTVQHQVSARCRAWVARVESQS